MKRTIKRVLSCVIATALCLSITSTAFASTSTKSAGNYGTLKGTMTVSSSKAYASVSITTNPDNAYLTFKAEVVNSAGISVVEPYESYSNTGVTSYSDSSATLPSSSYKIFGTHGVQGGSTNPSYAVYTSTSI